MQRGTLNQGISTTFIFNSIYFYISKFHALNKLLVFSSLQNVLSIVEIPIVFFCLNILVSLKFMLEVCYLNVLVFMMSLKHVVQLQLIIKLNMLKFCLHLFMFVAFKLCQLTFRLLTEYPFVLQVHCLHQVEEKFPLCSFVCFSSSHVLHLLCLQIVHVHFFQVCQLLSSIICRLTFIFQTSLNK